ncbi:MAG TPA: carbonic anhydrase [Thermomicrobiales bacterium]|nr:carbonic anhydrase [Thermomicrobiales bacterium]
MSTFDDVRAANDAYAAGFDKGDLPTPPARKLAVLTCMDARIDPAKALGLNEGDAHVIRNAGGRASDDAIRSLIISEELLGTDAVFVVHHTECGMLSFTNEQLASRLRDHFGVDPGAADYLPFRDLDQSVRDDVATLRANPFIPDTVDIRGFVYDVHTGRLRAVE